MTETGDIGPYVSLREKWHRLLVTQERAASSPEKDALYNALTAEWFRMSPVEKRCAGFHCRMVFH